MESSKEEPRRDLVAHICEQIERAPEAYCNGAKMWAVSERILDRWQREESRQADQLAEEGRRTIGSGE